MIYKKIEKAILDWFQSQLGTAKIENETLGELARGIVGRIIQSVAMTNFPLLPSWRVKLQKMRGVKIGKNVFIGLGCYLDPLKPELITLEDEVSLAGNVTIFTHSDPTAPIREFMGNKAAKIAPVTIKRGAWITIGCIILTGVTVGECSIISAGSVVTSDIPPYSIARGSPARVVMDIRRFAKIVQRPQKTGE